MKKDLYTPEQIAKALKDLEKKICCQSASQTPLFPLQGTGTATDNVTGDLNDSNLTITGGMVGIGITPTTLFQVGISTLPFLGVDTTVDNENVFLGAQNATNDNSYGVFYGSSEVGSSLAYIESRNPTNDFNTSNVKTTTADTFAQVQIRADFNDGVKYSEIIMSADGVTSLVQVITDIFQIVTLQEYADDAAAALGGLPVNGLYRTGSIVKIRVA